MFLFILSTVSSSSTCFGTHTGNKCQNTRVSRLLRWKVKTHFHKLRPCRVGRGLSTRVGTVRDRQSTGHPSVPDTLPSHTRYKSRYNSSRTPLLHYELVSMFSITDYSLQSLGPSLVWYYPELTCRAPKFPKVFDTHTQLYTRVNASFPWDVVTPLSTFPHFYSFSVPILVGDSVPVTLTFDTVLSHAAPHTFNHSPSFFRLTSQTLLKD